MSCEVISREQAVARLRRGVVMLLEEGKSLCQIAGERHILCGGFRHYDDDEFRRVYGFLGDAKTPRAELERRANAWQLERQQIERTPIACDVQRRFYETCRGWDDFTNGDLAQFCFEVLGQNVVVTGPQSPAVV